MAEKITALVDASLYAASVCEHAAWISQRTGAPVQLLHVLGRRQGAAPQDLSGSIRLGARTRLLEELAELDAQRARISNEHGRAILDDARALTEAAGATDVTTRLMHGDLIDTVADLQSETRVVLIGKRGEAADFAKGHLGSNLERVVRISHKPVLVASRAFRPVSKVLIAFDGGASAQKAVDYMATSPLYRDLTLELAMVGGPDPERQRKIEAAATTLRDAGLDASARRVEGQPETALARLVEDDGFDMLVMGAYGHSRIRSLMIGSTTTQMIQSCKVPLLLFR
ncbi:universal stress protein [Paracoccus sp. R12_1]|uniref:universal stress protein n=1 Tax=unclassified Paracoccus (in: a-proteobacteria) TaxID=2688777 RepID=UPI001ADCD3F9|nr:MULTISPECIES: universal stress protein [unclassified Paracoccus (in: a-proteobacteria)]MBO9454487.1 universal stress protein [Paracoccus sp. R12_2]MBO9486041.1 universal stress protein [Paracoccus sp. R12_1]